MSDDRQTDFFVVVPYPIIAMGAHFTQVYAVLRKRADNADGTCWPSHKRIAEDAGISVRRVQQVLIHLRDAGWIDWEQRKSQGKDVPNTSNVYKVFGSATGRQDVPTGTHQVPTGTQDVPTPPRQDVPTGTHQVPSELRTTELEPREELNTQCAAAHAPDAFDEFWSVYPAKKAKGAARKAWITATKKATPEAIIAAAARYRDDPYRGFTKHPATWLNGECWEDEDSEPPPSEAKPGAISAYASVAVALAQAAAPQLEIAQ